MKRVNEVFELPVDEMDICEAVDHYSEEKDAAIVRAINHVDALADALELAIPHFESHRELGKVGELHLDNAKAALAAYRGEK